MSVEKVKRRSGIVWRVRWRDASGRARSHVAGSKKDALVYEADVIRRKRMGELASLDVGKETLREFARDWWTVRVEHLAPKTQSLYRYLFDTHIEPWLGDHALRDLRTPVIERWHTNLIASGVGVVAARKALTLLGGILERACATEVIARNPVRHIRTAPLPRRRAVRPLAPEQVEKLRDALGRRDATLVSVLAYAGLRPGEAQALTWGHVRDRTLLVEQAVSRGVLRATKTGQRRTVPLLVPLATDLAEWRLASGRPADDAFVFPSQSGQPWREIDWQYWRRYVYGPAARSIGFDRSRPYDLRHSYASLRIAERANVLEIARAMGHGANLTLSTYGHLFDESGIADTSAEEAIRVARSHPVTGASSLAAAGI